MKEKPVKRDIEKTKKRKVKVGRLILFACIAVYGIMFFHAFFWQMIKTYVVTYGSIEDTQNVTGYIIRNEKVINSDANVTLKPVKNEGDRVAKGTVIATIRGQSVNDLEKKIADIDQNIEKIVSEQKKNQVSTAIFSSDIRSIDKNIEDKVFRLSTEVNSENLEGIIELKSDIDTDLKQRAEISGQLGPASQYIKNLIAQKENYEKSITAQEEKVISDSSGIVSYHIDGYENAFIPEKIQDVSLSQLEALGNIQPSSENSGIKIVDNYECYIATILEDKKKSSELKIGDKLTIKLPDIEEDEIPVTVDSITDKGQGKTLVVFSITQDIDKLLTCRKTNVEVIWSQFSGLKIPSSSLVSRNGKEGVISVRANYASFREVEVIKKDKDFAIVKEAASKYEVGIQLYEEIVINGANVKEGRQIRNFNQ